jgi:hypothetical protein
MTQPNEQARLPQKAGKAREIRNREPVQSNRREATKEKKGRIEAGHR